MFNNCFGYENCGWFRVELVDFGNGCSYRDKINYVLVIYSCIKGNLDKNKLLKICILF